LKGRLLALLLVVFLVFSTFNSSQIGSAEYDGWENIGPGVDYQKFVLPGPAVAHVARMDKANQEVTIESSIAQGRLALGAETVSAMANRYDGAINFWPNDEGEIGATNRVLVAINGFYIENWGTYTPRGGQTHSGWYSKWHGYLSPNEPWGWGFGWKYNRTSMIGECMAHLPATKQRISMEDSKVFREIHRVNVGRSTGNLIVYTPQYNWRTPLSNTPDVVDILVEMQTPNWIMPLENYAKGIVKDKFEGTGGTVIPFDHVVLSVRGQGDNQEFLLELSPGDEIRISQEINYNNDCNPVFWDWNRTYASIEGHFYFLKNGEINSREDHSNARIREPRTAVAFNDQYVYYIVVDGRQAGYSWGMTIGQLGDFAKSYLDATFGISLDGGGSSTMVVNGVIVNKPSDACYHLYLPQVIDSTDRPPPPVYYDPPENFWRAQAGTCERLVGNGMMIVAIERNEASTAFEPGQYLRTIGEASLRLGPGTNYIITNVLQPNTLLQVVKHSLDMDGVYAKGQYWWKVQTLGPQILEGWVIEPALEGVVTSSSLLQR
jgi:hypothetical protein